MAKNQEEPTDRALLLDVHTAISENELRKQLLTTYKGIIHVHRCIDTTDNLKTPKQLVQIHFQSTKQAEEFIENGWIPVGNLRCRVKALQPSIPVQKENKRNKESGNQSEILIEEDQVTHKILVHDVPTDIAENDLKKKLVQVYQGVKHVKRWYSRNEPSIPTENVQIDFESPENTKAILQKGFINIGQLYWPVTALKSRKHQQNQVESESQQLYQSRIFFEEDLLETFEDQKKQLNDLMFRYNALLNEAIQHL
ncbi:unnamed protein product [Rotaria magnacalcarata]|uniref:RRM domain-containing protein n=4 Tax=Rotaria magnacalcarata TaxID=392030 RepID=A0A816LLD8_9BILA|nr:unnamed protein product [Rotaria magnacalcarata]CAF1921438.1 unnamed protein product [Rotaria magnacalcarata]CAF1943447.1 unnamed protein product [Rotaria magnacalcarata]CAF2077635.1 unnamed protein product [Rotaria magnacalcarata]